VAHVEVEREPVKHQHHRGKPYQHEEAHGIAAYLAELLEPDSPDLGKRDHFPSSET
jgi:hypothetical protein